MCAWKETGDRRSKKKCLQRPMIVHDRSDHDEARDCPNPHSPRSWWACKNLDECHSPVTIAYAKAARKPRRLTCLDNGHVLQTGVVCDLGSKYFLANITEWDSGGLFVGCFLRDGGGGDGGDGGGSGKGSSEPTSTWPAYVCTPPLVMDDLATIFTFDAAEFTHLNDPSVCGYNIIPYSTLAVVQSRFSITEHVGATDFTIEWSRTSYASKKAEGLDYTLLERSTYPMPKVTKAGAMWQF